MRRGPEAHFEGSGPGVKRVSGPNWRPTECRGKEKDGGRDLNGVPGGRRATKAIPCSFPTHPSGRQEVRGVLVVPSGVPRRRTVGPSAASVLG
ncbi:hypothetical protein NDU88_007806 [Pleurodeles waltl]|uniref:Uncharacterized protein n=1 Tax=Pleurodeles waltl TaxID=8319 RepID=A0AAV7RSU4_PLEWA|nr:hypothetical protein NDU88_007806 [Pleurodeles waltl]